MLTGGGQDKKALKCPNNFNMTPPPPKKKEIKLDYWWLGPKTPPKGHKMTSKGPRGLEVAGEKKALKIIVDLRWP